MVMILFAAEVHCKDCFTISAKVENANQEMRSADIPTICDR